MNIGMPTGEHRAKGGKNPVEVKAEATLPHSKKPPFDEVHLECESEAVALAAANGRSVANCGS